MKIPRRTALSAYRRASAENGVRLNRKFCPRRAETIVKSGKMCYNKKKRKFPLSAGVAELADATDLGSVSQEWEFESLRPHQRKDKGAICALFSCRGFRSFTYW